MIEQPEKTQDLNESGCGGTKKVITVYLVEGGVRQVVHVNNAQESSSFLYQIHSASPRIVFTTHSPVPEVGGRGVTEMFPQVTLSRRGESKQLRSMPTRTEERKKKEKHRRLYPVPYAVAVADQKIQYLVH